MADIFFNREQMWFGTEERMGWIETPQTGAEVSPVGFGAEATLQNGGGYARNSWDSHKVFQFSWGDSASRTLAAKIHGYRNGSYGRGLIYFHDPMYYDMNVLARRVADPSMALNYEAPPLIYDLYPRSTPTAANTNELPVNTTIYDVPVGYNAQTAGDEIFIPIPPGFTLHFGAFYTSTHASAVLYARTPLGSQNVTQNALSATNVVPQSITGQPWARIGMKNASTAIRPISITAIIARLQPPGEAAELEGPWTPGEGHSGCSFVGSPTLINYNGVGGGQVGLAATLNEVGAWR